MQNEVNSLKEDPRLRPVKGTEELFSGDVFHINCIGAKEELIGIYSYLTETGRFSCLLQKEYYSEVYWCEVMPKNATKGNSVLVLKEKLHYDKVISFGDGLNDISMFEISDECYAVENALEELRKYATGMIMSNDNDGVAHWLAKNYL